jgi:hypothetical protein
MPSTRAQSVTHESRAALARARFFLGKAQACTASERLDFEAFLEAAIVFARTAIHRFQKHYRQNSGFSAWWDSLLNDAAVDFFRTERDWILKEAPPKIGQVIFMASGDPDATAYVPGTAGEFYFFEPHVPATVTVDRHLQSLESCLAAAERRFST